MTIVPFGPLPRDVLREIVELKLRGLGKRLEETHRIATEVAPETIESLVERCTEAETGARNVDHVLRGTLLPQLSRALLERFTSGEKPTRLRVGIDAQGGFALDLST
jgi:type VI secretion system protein VasG